MANFTIPLFSYGTLQLPKVQRETFGRILQGQKEVVLGYKIELLKITHAEVLKRSEQDYHPMAVYTGKQRDKIEGMCFLISKKELQQSDEYEVDDYQRVWVEFQSGNKGWIYVAK